MTTIAANRKCMAADRKVTGGDASYSTVKIRRIGEAVVGCAGDNTAIAKFVRWLESGKKDEPPKFGKDDSLEALVLTRAGLFIYDTGCEPDEIKDACFAVGSGRQAALTAMRCYKASPKRAVEVACKVDNDTAGPVDVLSL
jgi:ATP-dependent protease HslVU (ClpYQ) peptidase subunit